MTKTQLAGIKPWSIIIMGTVSYEQTYQNKILCYSNHNLMTQLNSASFGKNYHQEARRIMSVSWPKLLLAATTLYSSTSL